MAALTMDLGMGTVEFVIGIFIVIEEPHPPTIRIVADSTFAAEGTLMHVIFLMACIACVGIHLVVAGKMTLFAGHRRVKTDEGKVGNVMVENHVFIPFLFVVAAGTLFTLFALVNVIILMAGKTGVSPLFFV